MNESRNPDYDPDCQDRWQHGQQSSEKAACEPFENTSHCVLRRDQNNLALEPVAGGTMLAACRLSNEVDVHRRCEAIDLRSPCICVDAYVGYEEVSLKSYVRQLRSCL